ncbi:VOC family protein [Streptomyces sp. BE282]|uniref:VOC family protein n=1 Tax=Streptomyces sp. BE282 TaxID=3002527 RepID=UPI002E7CD984|nr:VOC family protein [Streptomyces sp. BE282]
MELRAGPFRRGRLRDRDAQRAGGVHGGDPGAGPYLFFRVDDMAAAVAQVRELGGSLEGPDLGDDEETEETAARFGQFQLCRDDQGSPFGLHEPPGVR